MNNKISITVNVTDNHRLSDCIAKNKKHLIQELVVLGNYFANSDDDFLKSMCNSIDKNGMRTGGQLEILDLSKAHLFKGKTNVDVSRQLLWNSFEGCITLRIIKLGELDTIDAHMFSGCISLESIWYTPNYISTKDGYHHSFISDDGILYECKYSNGIITGKRKLIKYPSAYVDPRKIRFQFVDEIVDYAFEDFKGSDLYMSTVPPSCNKLAFQNVDVTKITLHVPNKSFNSYWSHPFWGNFQIVENE